jgi:hypothetical protein
MNAHNCNSIHETRNQDLLIKQSCNKVAHEYCDTAILVKPVLHISQKCNDYHKELHVTGPESTTLLHKYPSIEVI